MRVHTVLSSNSELYCIVCKLVVVVEAVVCRDEEEKETCADWEPAVGWFGGRQTGPD